MEQLLNNKYEILILPVNYNKSFLDFTKEEIKKYYQWFLNIKSIRLSHICNLLFSNYDECLQEKNLNVIEIFLQNSISTIPKPKEQFNSELKKIPHHLKPYAKPDDYLLDNRTISICYDVGIFMGDLIITIDNKIKWELETDNKYADYGQPVLSKKGCKLKINPFRVAKNLSTRIYEGRYDDKDIINTFNVWKKGFKIIE